MWELEKVRLLDGGDGSLYSDTSMQYLGWDTRRPDKATRGNKASTEDKGGIRLAVHLGSQKTMNHFLKNA